MKNKFVISLLIVVGASVFGLVFIKQLQTAKNELATTIANDKTNSLYPAVAGARFEIPQQKGDSTTQLNKEVEVFSTAAIENDNAKLEQLIKQLP